MIRRVRELRSDEDLSAITLNPSSVLMSGEDVSGRESAGQVGREPAEEQPKASSHGRELL